MQLHEGDAADYVLKLAAEVREGRIAPLDMVCVDAFDGNDDVPASLWSSGEGLARLEESAIWICHSLLVCSHKHAEVLAAAQSYCLKLK